MFNHERTPSALLKEAQPMEQEYRIGTLTYVAFFTKKYHVNKIVDSARMPYHKYVFVYVRSLSKRIWFFFWMTCCKWGRLRKFTLICCDTRDVNVSPFSWYVRRFHLEFRFAFVCCRYIASTTGYGRSSIGLPKATRNKTRWCYINLLQQSICPSESLGDCFLILNNGITSTVDRE